MDRQSSAPPVVAVLVTCDPGSWLEEALSALALQDYPNLSVLVVDAASADDPTARVAEVLPTAYVRRLTQRVGFGRAANEVLGVVDGASHLLLCHDDVAPGPGAVRIMVEEAFRSNAGIVCPKLVEWDRPDRLLSVGQSADKVGAMAPLVERGEFDQEQHDAVRDVFWAPGGCTLVRTDLFSALGGYEPSTDLLGEDLNLSWRAQVAGARVLVTPEAKVRHLEALSSGLRPGWDDRGARARVDALSEQHRIRTILTCYSGFHLVRILPQAVLETLAQAVVRLVSGRGRAAAASFAAWRWALHGPSQLRAARRDVRAHRSVRDAEVRRLQARGSARVRSYVRAHLAGEGVGGARTARSAAVAQSLRSGSWRMPTTAWAIVALVLLFGTRGLVGHVPAFGLLPVLRGGPVHWWRLWLSGWRSDGLGSGAPPPPALALLALAGTVLFGALGVLSQLLVLAPLVLGPLGAYRTARVWGSTLGQAAALVVYAAVPLPYNALAGGRWPGLVAYAAAPWLLGAVIRDSGDTPVAPRRRLPVRVVGLALLVALTAAFVPAVLVLLPLIGVGLLAGSVLSGRVAAGLRALGVALVAAALGAVLLLPWSADVLRSPTALFGVAPGAGHRLAVGGVVAFRTGPFGGGPWSWGLVAAAALPLAIGRGWRLVWATRLWGVAAACWTVTWLASRGTINLPIPTPEVILAPAATALAGAAALGAVAFQQDLPGFRFGWRQLAPAVAAAAVALASLPVMVAAVGGRWHVPLEQPADALGFLERPGGGYRVLWVGAPQALPLAGWRLKNGVSYATSVDGLPDASALWPPSQAGATPVLAQDLRLATAGRTTGLGHLLAPLAIRYIVIPNRVAPDAPRGSGLPQPEDLLTALGQQVDLRSVAGDQSLTVYDNVAWAPERYVLPVASAAPSHSGTPEAAEAAPLAGSQPVLTGNGPDWYSGVLPGGRDVIVSATGDRAWALSVDGHVAPRRPAFGWAMAFAVPGSGGRAQLRYGTPSVRYLELAGQVVVWLAALAFFALGRSRRRGGHAAGRGRADALGVKADRPAPLAREPALAGARRRHLHHDLLPPAFDDEEWPS
jgi:GT2 family glycosyltransferase